MSIPYKNRYPFPLITLPYSYCAKEPYIDTETMKLHHSRHLKTYVDTLNKTLAPHPNYHSWSLESLIIKNFELPEPIRHTVKNNAGGVYNHNLFFAQLASPTPPPLITAITEKFGTLDSFKASFTTAALSVFGSGYAWLTSDSTNTLHIITTPNQTTPLEQNLQPLLTLDVWEHAYYLKHHNLRLNYINAWLELMF